MVAYLMFLGTSFLKQPDNDVIEKKVESKNQSYSHSTVSSAGNEQNFSLSNKEDFGFFLISDTSEGVKNTSLRVDIQNFEKKVNIMVRYLSYRLFSRPPPLSFQL